jgi:poly(A) polymerase
VKPVQRIKPTDWMRAPATSAVIDALRADGQEVRFVGGCVRDSLLGGFSLDAGDIDIATPDRPERVMALLDRTNIKNIPTGLAHGTITAVVARRHFEITTLRVDVKSHGRHADVAFTDNWQEDAARRDFTMNALTCTPEGDLYDPYGGIADLEAGLVRFVGDAMRRIEEDHLRLLRFFRFHAWFGKGAPDSTGLAAAVSSAQSLRKLSGERIRNEMLKLLAAKDPALVIDIMAAGGVLAEIVPVANDTQVLRGLQVIEAETEADPVRRLASLVGDGADAKALAERLRLSNEERDRLVAMLSPPGTISAALDAQALRRDLYAHGAARMIDWLILAWAENGNNIDSYRRMITAAKSWQPIALPIKGADALVLGRAAGPEIGDLLKAVEGWWITADFAPTRDQCLEKLRNLAGDAD